MYDPDPKIWLGEHGILRVRYPRNSGLTLEVMEQAHRQRFRLTDQACQCIDVCDCASL
jgi:hypothetical protein